MDTKQEQLMCRILGVLINCTPKKSILHEYELTKSMVRYEIAKNLDKEVLATPMQQLKIALLAYKADRSIFKLAELLAAIEFALVHEK